MARGMPIPTRPGLPAVPGDAAYDGSPVVAIWRRREGGIRAAALAGAIEGRTRRRTEDRGPRHDMSIGPGNGGKHFELPAEWPI